MLPDGVVVVVCLVEPEDGLVEFNPALVGSVDVALVVEIETGTPVQRQVLVDLVCKLCIPVEPVGKLAVGNVLRGPPRVDDVVTVPVVHAGTVYGVLKGKPHQVH